MHSDAVSFMVYVEWFQPEEIEVREDWVKTGDLERVQHVEFYDTPEEAREDADYWKEIQGKVPSVYKVVRMDSPDCEAGNDLD